MGDRRPSYPDVATMMEQGAVSGSYKARVAAALAVPAASRGDIAKKRSDTLIEAGTDETVKQPLSTQLIVGPFSFEATNARFKHDTEAMLAAQKGNRAQARVRVFGLTVLWPRARW